MHYEINLLDNHSLVTEVFICTNYWRTTVTILQIYSSLIGLKIKINQRIYGTMKGMTIDKNPSHVRVAEPLYRVSFSLNFSVNPFTIMPHSTKLSKSSAPLLGTPLLWFAIRSSMKEGGTAYPRLRRASVNSRESIFPLRSLSYL